MGAFRPFTLRLIIERDDFNDAMLPVVFVSIDCDFLFCITIEAFLLLKSPPLISPVGFHGYEIGQSLVILEGLYFSINSE